jgi:hypothetical protein
MIQRRQTLFMLVQIFNSVLLMFIPSERIILQKRILSAALIKVQDEAVHSTPGHIAAAAINFLLITCVTISIFLYRRRKVQLRLCFVSAGMWLILGLLIAFCPFLNTSEGGFETYKNYPVLFLPFAGIISALFAARFIRRDIELLKSADRIR